MCPSLAVMCSDLKFWRECELLGYAPPLWSPVICNQVGGTVRGWLTLFWAGVELASFVIYNKYPSLSSQTVPLY